MAEPSGDNSLDTLLELDGMRLVLTGDGHWAKIDVVRVPAPPERPHGIAYSLTLHAPDDERLLGYDNAHPVKSGRGPGAARPVAYDHRHGATEARPYGYRSAADLLADFWADVDRMLNKRGAR
ncbi:MAG TPA: DUF6516 family protein [Azospirillaceae bacterium]|nr:DUF6516 family protein [Azospirillaceae bacterium]